VIAAGRDLHVTVRARSRDGQRIDCAGPDWRIDDVVLALAGAYQPANALLAVAAARQLGARDAAIRSALARVSWPGRFQIIGTRPWLVADGAHNIDGARALAESLRELFPGEPLSLVCGLSSDKDASGILGVLVPLAERVVLTRSSNPRAASPEGLRAAMPSPAPPVAIAPDANASLALMSRPPRAPVTCVAGSLYLVADVLRALGGDREKPCSIEKPAASIEFLFS
jgi:dihydrofolate synthase/folylpolyglutamate synthase